MSLTPAETARKIADIIDNENERFDMEVFQTERECGTVGCIAGHTALLHGDRLYEGVPERNDDGGDWLSIQGLRLGLTKIAAARLFYPVHHTGWLGENPPRNDRRYGLVLRQLERELADREPGDLIDRDELETIAAEALGR